MHFLPKKHCFWPKKAFFLPKDLQKVRKSRQILIRDKIAYVRAYSFRSSPNFSAGAPRAPAQLLPPCLEVRAIKATYKYLYFGAGWQAVIVRSLTFEEKQTERPSWCQNSPIGNKCALKLYIWPISPLEKKTWCPDDHCWSGTERLKLQVVFYYIPKEVT